jgi:feruloyl esterase
MADTRSRRKLPWPPLVVAAAATVLLAAGSATAATPARAEGSLTAVTAFGSNPGNLLMYSYRPAGSTGGRALVVALHGCTQNAADYFSHSGWQKYADLWGFTLVLPEQKRANNSSLCFNWFTPDDTTRGRGEALSIRQMIGYATGTYGSDPGRVFVTGLSAGGAMTGVLLATYPDVFAGGAVIGGLAYRCATDLLSALNCMSSPPNRTPRQWGDLVRGADPGYSGPYPRVSIWYGTADATVVPANADELRDQWTDVSRIGTSPTTSTNLPGNTTRFDYANSAGTPLVRVYRVSGIAHGTPVHPGGNVDQCGVPARYYLDSICSTYQIAVGWGLP